MKADLFFLALVSLAALSDLSSRRVSNTLNFSLLILGLFCSVAGWTGISVLSSFLGAVTALAVLILPFSLEIYRGGDVKLCIAMGSWVGTYQILWVIALGVIGGGVLGLIILALKGRAGSQTQTVPMAVSFALSGIYILIQGVPW